MVTKLHILGNTPIIYSGNINQTRELMFFIDLNGALGPNRFGRDVFIFAINDKGYLTSYPAHRSLNDLNSIKVYCAPNSNVGEWCARKIEYDGWKIKDDYPW